MVQRLWIDGPEHPIKYYRSEEPYDKELWIGWNFLIIPGSVESIPKV